MAHEPKLEVYTIHLQPTKTLSDSTFGAFLCAEQGPNDPQFTLSYAYKKFFSDFISSIDDSYYSHEKRKKAIGLKSTKKGGKINKSLTYKSEQQIIEGRIKGGRYGQSRSIGDMSKPQEDHEPLPNTKIVLDDFYFQLYTPFGSSKGILMIQSYSDDQINDIFIGFLRGQLKTTGFYKPTVVPFCPTHIQEEFKNSSVVKEVRFRQEILVPDIEETQTINSKDLIIEIKITTKENGEQLSTFNDFKKVVKKFIFKSGDDDITLGDFKTKVGTLTNDKYQSSFQLDSDFDIKPTIYLKGRITLQDDESPDWNSLKVFCDDLLIKIKEEVYPENEVS